MISIALIIISVFLVISGNMPLLGGKRARGNLVRIGGGVMLCLSILSMLAPENVSFILLMFIYVMSFLRIMKMAMATLRFITHPR